MNWDNLVTKYDKSDYLGKIVGFPEQCKEGWRIGQKTKIRKVKGIEKIFVAGMGGSGYVGELLQKLFFQTSKIPVFIEHGYILPNFVDKKTLCIIVSYSGNTDEAITIFKQVRKKKIPTIGITAGGYLEKTHKQNIVVPGGLQPRQATGYLFFSLLAVLRKMSLSPFTKKDMLAAVKQMEKEQKRLMGTAKKLASTLHGKTPVLYVTEKMQVSALRWQQELNEIGKAFCHWNILPELQHNEINASKNLGKAHFILLRSGKESRKMEVRISYMKKRIKSIGYNSTEIKVGGKGILTETWHANYLGSLTAFYLSMLNHLDPTPVTLIQSMKVYLKKHS
tara:strand:+ start:449 stop:1456 length:1008 start_codon:yes stop_codon:yes gene_type:complete